jgi:hypothetical protein
MASSRFNMCAPQQQRLQQAFAIEDMGSGGNKRAKAKPKLKGKAEPRRKNLKRKGQGLCSPDQAVSLASALASSLAMASAL